MSGARPQPGNVTWIALPLLGIADPGACRREGDGTRFLKGIEHHRDADGGNDGECQRRNANRRRFRLRVAGLPQPPAARIALRPAR